jgi:membrane-associated phospholipid phosphatase
MTIEVIEFLQSFRNGFFDFIFNTISFLGEEYIYIAILGVIYYGINKRLGEVLAFSLFFTASINTIIKGLVGALRPFEKYPLRVENLRPDTAGGHSFPSGHTQNFTTFYYTLAIKLNKRYLFIIAGVLAVLMAMSRMYLGVHFLEDVSVSIVLGIIVALIVTSLYNKYKDTAILHYIYIGILIGLFPFLFFIQEKDFYTSYGLMFGFVGAMIFEQNYVQFDLQVPVIKKALRIVIGIGIMLAIQIGVKAIFVGLFGEDIILLDLIRYALIAFIGLGLYPILFKKFNF